MNQNDDVIKQRVPLSNHFHKDQNPKNGDFHREDDAILDKVPASLFELKVLMNNNNRRQRNVYSKLNPIT